MPRSLRLAVPMLCGGLLLTSGAVAAPAMTPADAAFVAEMAAMQREMAAAAMTGDADRDFVAMMVPHHASAIAMARTELRYGHSPELRRLAGSIVADQQREITQMRDWQAAHPHG